MKERQSARRVPPMLRLHGDGPRGSGRPARLLRLLESGALSDQQARAVETFFDMFADLRAIGVPDHHLAPGVVGPSEPVMEALAAALATPHSSVDVVGAANVEHLASVFRGVLADAVRAADGAPLTQPRVDRLVLETVLTDAFMKGRQPGDLETAATVPTNYGSTGGSIFSGMKRYLKDKVNAEGPISPTVRSIVEGWIDRGSVPAAKSAVWLEAGSLGLSQGDTAELIHVWKYRIMQRGRAIAAQGFLQGTWLHGIPSYELVLLTVTAARVDPAEAPAIMESVLAHHMAGFVASGFAKGGLEVDFAALERDGQIPPGAGAKLEALYRAAAALADKWRPLIDHAAFHGHGLAPREREAYYEDATDLRAAIAALTPAGRSQLLNDDSMQFTDLGMPKWLAMGRAFYGLHGEISNGELLQAVYGKMVQPYLEENLARGSAKAFLAGTAPVAERLGMRLDPNLMVYVPAEPGEPAFEALARQIALDARTAAAIQRDLQKPAELLSSEALVDWFVKQPADIDALARLAGRRPAL